MRKVQPFSRTSVSNLSSPAISSILKNRNVVSMEESLLMTVLIWILRSMITYKCRCGTITYQKLILIGCISMVGFVIVKPDQSLCYRGAVRREGSCVRCGRLSRMQWSLPLSRVEILSVISVRHSNFGIVIADCMK
jgi:hypothetical protein